MRSIGTAFATCTKDAFDDPSLRPASWAPVKHAGKPLYQTGLLRRSIRVTSSSAISVTVGTDRPYAAYQNYGTWGPYRIAPIAAKALAWKGAAHPVSGVIMHPGIPARPFFPVRPDGSLTTAAAERIIVAAEASLKLDPHWQSFSSTSS